MTKKIFGSLILAATLTVGAISPSLAETLRIEVNKASILKLVETPSTIIVGNPALADVSPQENNVLVLVGKASGRTNIIILDENGDIMHNYDIAVQEEQSGNLTLYKAGAQWSYSCAPYCERVINPNDDEDAFQINMAQVLLKSNQMTGAALAAAAGTNTDGLNNYAVGVNGAVVPVGGGVANGPPPEQLQTFTVLPPQQ